MAETRRAFSLLVTEFMSIALIFALLPLAVTLTDPYDVQTLKIMYTTLNSPPQLTGWKIIGGDPCRESWEGIGCEGSSVVSIELSGLGLNGTLGYLLSNLISLREFDLSDNKIDGTIPYQLPPNLARLNLARNNLSGNLPYTISAMVFLSYMNVSHNALTLTTGEVFSNLADLGTLDLSFNNFSGDLPSSFGSLSNLSSLFLQNNQLTGSLDALVGLHLNTLNVANNHFTGRIPHELSSIPNFIYHGNSFDDGAAPSLPPRTSPSPFHNNDHHSGSDSGCTHGIKGFTIGEFVDIILASVFLAIILLGLCCCFRMQQQEDRHARTSNRSLPLGTNNVTLNPNLAQHGIESDDVTTNLELPPAEELLPAEELPPAEEVMKSPIMATSYTVASLQSATNNFSQEFLIGEGSFGRVYKAEFPNRKIMAIKKIDNVALPLQEEDNFLEAVSIMSRLRHPNIVTLTGYCAERGQRILVYEYMGNGNLHNMLHVADYCSVALSWNARVWIALGMARALEYLHEVSLPSVVHKNFKSVNILLDEELNPHLSDCGLAALTPNATQQVSTEMVCSFGYSAPEFASSGTYTVKSDIYSFGVVMLELLTGRKPLDSSRVESEQSLVRWATPQLCDIDALTEIVDPAMNGMYPAKSLSCFADTIALCVQPEPELRPPMSEVVQALVRLVQRGSVARRGSSDDSGFGGQRHHKTKRMSF